MNRLLYGVVDITKALFTGIIIGAILTAIFGGIGLIINKGSIINALEVSRSALLLVGSLGMLCSAALLLKKDSLRPLENKDGWNKHFKVVHFVYVIFVLFVGVIIIGSSIDYIIYFIK